MILGFLSYGRISKLRGPGGDTTWANERTLAIVVLIVAIVLGLIVWEYVKEWRRRKAFKRYWEERKSAPLESQAQGGEGKGLKDKMASG